MAAAGVAAVTGYRPQSDKIIRMHMQTAAIENGLVLVAREAPWLGDYLHEFAVFPHGRHDDQVDATAQFLDWFKRAAREDGIYAYYRMLYEEKCRREGAAPP